MQEIKFRNDMKVELIKTNASDLDVARAAWVSTLAGDAREKDEGRVAGLIDFLWRGKLKHTSPFEHGSFTFYVETTLAVTREFHRHRTWSYNEWSGRYSEILPHFYIPTSERPLVQVGKIGNYTFEAGSDTQQQSVAHARKHVAKTAYGLYQSQLANGICKEVAREVLPLNMYTYFYATANPLNVMRFMSLRTDEAALYEIRDIAGQIEEYFKAAMPITWKVWNDYGRTT